MRKLLVVAYYTPPLGMSGVMRVTKLVKFLPRCGWEPVVLTVKPIRYFHYDPALLEDWKGIRVYRAESWDPARLSWRLGLRSPMPGNTTGRAGRLSNAVLFPDAKVGWYRSALRLGLRIVRDEQPVAVFATAPPFTALRVGAELKRRCGLPLVSDFRDPWPTGFVAPAEHRREKIERFRHEVLAASDAVLAVNQGTADFLEGRAEVLDNGYDPDEFEVPARRLDGFSLLHLGNLWGNIPALRAVLDATRELPDVRVYHAGSSAPADVRQLAGYPQFTNLGLQPHAVTMATMKGADVLLYLGKPDQSAGIKLYEYLGARRPILSVGSAVSEADRLIKEHRAGLTVEPEAAVIPGAIASLRWDSFASVGVERFSRLEQARRLAAILDRIAH